MVRGLHEPNFDPSEGSGLFHVSRLGPANRLVPHWVDEMLSYAAAWGDFFAVFRPGLFRMKRIPPFCGRCPRRDLALFSHGSKNQTPKTRNCTDRKEREQHDNIKVHGYFSFPSDQLRAAIRCSGRFPDGGCAVAPRGLG